MNTRIQQQRLYHIYGYVVHFFLPSANGIIVVYLSGMNRCLYSSGGTGVFCFLFVCCCCGFVMLLSRFCCFYVFLCISCGCAVFSCVLLCRCAAVFVLLIAVFVAFGLLLSVLRFVLGGICVFCLLWNIHFLR